MSKSEMATRFNLPADTFEEFLDRTDNVRWECLALFVMGLSYIVIGFVLIASSLPLGGLVIAGMGLFLCTVPRLLAGGR